LFGFVNVLTNEWKDGFFGTIVRKNVINQNLEWIVLDGPVDNLWIENLNTVLDDNRTLCLTNGERIKISNFLYLLFEVDNLKEANPSTVSRCGMIYCDQKIISWRNIAYTYWPIIQEKF
jgi:dynein heavy chain